MGERTFSNNCKQEKVMMLARDVCFSTSGLRKFPGNDPGFRVQLQRDGN